MIYVSASQLRTLMGGCRRKWAWRYIAGAHEPTRESTDLGIAVHWVAEQILRGADLANTKPKGEEGLSALVTHDRAREVIAPGLDRLISMRGEVEKIEHEITIPIADGLCLTGKIDALLTDGTVIDHKTCASRRYVLSDEELARDVQALTYAWLIGSERTHVRWIYYLTRGAPESWEVRAIIERSARQAHVKAAMSAAVWARDQILMRAEPRDIACDVTQCRAYGGCAYKELCAARASLADMAKLQERPMAEQRDLLMELRQRKAAAASVTVPADPGINPPRPTDLGPTEKIVPVAQSAERLVETSSVDLNKQLSAPVKARRGRPPKICTGSASQEPPVTTQSCAGDLVLYVDCVPLSQSVRDLDLVVGEIAQRLCSDHELAHWALAEYGKGLALLASYAREAWADAPPHGSIVTTSSSLVYKALRQELLKIGARLVVGIR